jgi:hypothetical protein
MTDQLISFETAKFAKEKGFNIPVSKYYISDGSLKVNFEDSNGNEREYRFDADDFDENWNIKGWVISKDGGTCFGCKLDNVNYFIPYSAPTQSLLQKWIREVHNIHIMVSPSMGIVLTKVKDSSKTFGSISPQNTYEEALEVGLQEALTLIK